MGNLLGSLVIGGLLGVLFGILYYVSKDIAYQTEEKEKATKRKAVLIALVFLISFPIGSLYSIRATYLNNINKIKVVQESYLDSLKSERITEVERAAIANELSKLNGEIAELQYKKSQWYGFDIPKEVNDLEIVKLN